MNNRFKSVAITVLIQGAMVYVLVTGLALTISRGPEHKLTSVQISAKQKSPPPPVAVPRAPLAPMNPLPPADRPVILHDWAVASPAQRNADFMKERKWVEDNKPEEERRLERWRAVLPQGSGPGAVTRLVPANLPTHTVYWPAKWTKGPLPIVAWGNGFFGKCINSSLPYAAFLSEVASHGYLIVAVGNDDIDYPQPEGLAILADGRPLVTQASALRKGIDWAVAENGRAGSPFAGKLDTRKIAYMGHGCGGEQALAASADPRAVTTVLLNAAARFTPDPERARKASLAQFEGANDDSRVIEAGNANLQRAQAARWPMYRATLAGLGHDSAYPGPDRRWSKGVIAWLDWQLKGIGNAASVSRELEQNGWNRADTAGSLAASATIAEHPVPDGGDTPHSEP